jgi:hypothetical protein
LAVVAVVERVGIQYKFVAVAVVVLVVCCKAQVIQ